jgi:hypothetical protein
MTRIGYKIVNREGDHAISLADRKVKYPLHIGATILGPTYLGTSRAYAVDYYASGSTDPDDLEDLLLTVEYDDRDILKGNPDEPDQMTGGAEVLVRKAKLKSVESMRGTTKESFEMKITDYLDKVASSLESRGFLKEAYEIDVLANTIEAVDIMKQYAKPSQQEQMSELNFAAQSLKGKTPQIAQQDFVSFWGQEYGPELFQMAAARVKGDQSPQLFQKWESSVLRAQAAKRKPRFEAEPTKADPFMSQEEIAKAKKLYEEQQARARASESPFVDQRS